jgi:hypothetical protein
MRARGLLVFIGADLLGDHRESTRARFLDAYEVELEEGFRVA